MVIEEYKLISVDKEKDIDIKGNFVVPDEVTVIGAKVFDCCDSLISIDFKNVEFICREAFRYCTNLKRLNFKNVKKIGNSAFYHCANLESLNFKNVDFIVHWAFAFCGNIKEVIGLKYVARIQQDAFSGCNINT